MSRGNPLGLGVYNTKDEPAGLQQGVNRYSGVIPNFASKAFDPEYRAKVTGANNVNKTVVNNITIAGEAAGNFADKVNDNQGRLVALGVGLSLLQGQLMQFGDANNRFIQGLNQMTTAASSVTTAFGAFGGGKKGIAAAGSMLAIQGAAGLSANADKTFNTKMQNLNTQMEKAKEGTTKLEGTISSLTPTLNDYANELEKTDPDPEAINKFKMAILEGMSDLAPELQDQIRGKLGSAKEVMGVLAGEQRKGAIQQTTIGLQQLVGSEQGQARANMGLKGQFGKILAGTGIAGVSEFGQGLMKGEMKPTFQSKESISAAAGAAILPIAQNTEDFIKLADVLTANSTSAEGTFNALQQLYQSAGQSTEGLLALKAELSKNPEATKKVIEEMKKLTKTQLENAAAQGKIGQAVAPGYKGISKVFGTGMFNEQYQAQPMDDLNASLSRLAMFKGVKGPLQDRLMGRIALQQKAAGLEVSPEFQKGGARFESGRIKESIEKNAKLLEDAGFKEEADKLRTKLTENEFNPEEAAAVSFKEKLVEAGKDVPELSKMGSKVPEPTEEQKKKEAEAKAAEQGKKKVENAPTIIDTNLTGGNQTEARPQTDWMNTLFSTAGIASALPFLGGAAATGAVKGGAGLVRGVMAAGGGTALGGLGAAGAVTAGGIAGYGLGNYIATKTETGQKFTEKGGDLLAPLFSQFMGGPSEEEQAVIDQQSAAAQQQSKAIREQKLAQQQAVAEAPKAEVPQEQLDQAAQTAKAEKSEPTQVNNTISVSPSINIAQQAATDKAELQKMVEEEVKRFSEAIVKVADEKAKAREKGVVNPPQKLNLTA